MQKPDLHAPFDEYLAWRNQQSCSGCGLRFIDRPRDASGAYLDEWATETQCWDCFLKGTDHAPQS